MADPVKHLDLLRKIRDCHDLTSSEYLVLITLCLYGDENGKDIFPGREIVASDCAVDEKTVRRAYASLETKGYLSKDGRHNRRIQFSIPTEKFQPTYERKSPKKTTLTPYTPDVAPPPTNGNGHDDPYKRRDGETATAWARRVNSLVRKG